jgi:hypothetical protein
VEAVSRRCVHLLLLLAGLFVCAFPLFAQRPYDAYMTAMKRGVFEPQVHAFVAKCIGGTTARPRGFYSQGGWFATDNLPSHMRDSGADVDATAYAWMVGGKPQAVYQWTHDSEFDRDLLACMDASGRVTQSISRYMPGTSEPDQRWIMVRTVQWNPRTNQYAAHGRFTDWQGRPMGHPHMSSEDQDFIAGERTIRKWSDFDFARLVEH